MLNNIAKQDVVQIVGINYKDTKREGKYFLNRLGNPFDFIVFDEQGKLGLHHILFCNIVQHLVFCTTGNTPRSPYINQRYLVF
jgi:hypothetical protein